MKKTVLFTVFLTMVSILIAQDHEDTSEVFTAAVDEHAKFKEGGKAEFKKWIKSNITYPKKAKMMGISGKVYLEYIINRDGSISDIKVIKGLGYGCDEEAIRLMKATSYLWVPAKKDGKPVRQKNARPIFFKFQRK